MTNEELIAEVRRITWERDVALRERDEARTTLDEVRRQRNIFAAEIRELYRTGFKRGRDYTLEEAQRRSAHEHQ